MRKKLTLQVERLAVDSFDAGGPEDPRGTVVANAACTCNATCACPTAYYWCNTAAPFTFYSCEYTRNLSCVTTA